jgi:hypothetical protein
MALVSVVGDGANTLFWKDRWSNGQRIEDIAPSVHALVPKRIVNTRKVIEALLNMQWISDFQGALSFTILMEYFQLNQMLEHVVLQPGTTDTHIWRLSFSGIFRQISLQSPLSGHH